jgi:hypothetical protein
MGKHNKICATSVISQKLPKINKRPKGENSTNRVTLHNISQTNQKKKKILVHKQRFKN